ncbi:hypothetical protein N801_09820 [Knoellia aerolata DSM 18566]|uniref:Uncharacterized protein n=1 Tax=Knoellia aerolata DSM 18566 TaxID=1385519 RepID=A0A0A0JZW7_9MICO|nr:hypothetical protein N801_09820 [Knoellia aerolata DSM 18566]
MVRATTSEEALTFSDDEFGLEACMPTFGAG